MSVPPTQVVGMVPWFPWPLSAWRWLTEPVAAQRLAALRIAIGSLLTADIWFTYRPHLFDFYGKDGLGSPEVFAWRSQPDQFGWSLLRGAGDPMLSNMALAGMLLSLVWLIVIMAGRLGTGERISVRWPLLLTILAGTLVTCGVVARATPIELGEIWPLRLLRPWQTDDTLLALAFHAWLSSVLLLTLGCFTRYAAVAAWALTLSFANLNSYIDNAGDTVRNIILFHMMLCPAGAVWSVDRLWQRFRERRAKAKSDLSVDAPRVISPWVLRLLFVQMTFIYFCNGLFKVQGQDWREGESLYYVLSDLTLTRFSFEQLPLPMRLLPLMTWTVLAWELGFPLLVMLPWTRRFALFLGVLFHLGILATMELGFFQLYMLSLYVPLLPWEKWILRGRMRMVE